MENKWNELVKMTLTGQLSKQKSTAFLSQFTIAHDKKASVEKTTLQAIASFSFLHKSSQTFKKNAQLVSPKDTEPYQNIISIDREKQISYAIRHNYHSILIEILNQIKKNKESISFALLPQLLDYSYGNSKLKKALQPCLGSRGIWLAKLNDNWQSFLPIDANDTTPFFYGTELERLDFIEKFSSQNPIKARELIEEVWENEHFIFKEKLLKIIALHLSKNDIPFLENCLEEKRKNVRLAAAQLLGKLPQSPLAKRIKLLVKELVIFDNSKNKFEVILPLHCTKAMKKDGIICNIKHIKSQGEKANQLAQIITKTPLDWWTTTSKKKPEELLQIIAKTTWNTIFVWAWAWAAKNQGNKTWILALNEFRKNYWYQYQWEDVSLDFINEGLPNNLFNQIALSFAIDAKDDFLDKNPILINLLLQEGQTWDSPLTVLIIQKIQNAIATGSYAFEWNIKAILKRAAFVSPPKLYFQLKKSWGQNTNWNHWQTDIDTFLSILQLRAEINR